MLTPGLPEKIILVVVITLTVIAHIWIYLWVGFRIDEGLIMQFLNESEPVQSHSIEGISVATGLSIRRVSAVCRNSRDIRSESEGVFLV